MKKKNEDAIVEILTNTSLLIIIYSFLVFMPGALDFLERSNPIAMIIGMIIGGIVLVIGQCVYWKTTEKKNNSKFE